MKVYACPSEVPAPALDFTNFSIDRMEADEANHKAALKAWLIQKGYKGKNTGETISFPVADGHATYMLAEGSKSFLIHLPYGDAYQYREVTYIPKTEILRRITEGKKFAALFAKKKA